MVYLQVLRNGFPDPSFFGNTFVGLNLASNIPSSVLVANSKKGFLDQVVWKDLLSHNFGINLMYTPYIAHAHDNPVEGFDLGTLVQQTLDDSGKHTVVDFHFPDTDLEEPCISRLPRQFGLKVKQYVHLHCSSDFFFQRADVSEQRKADLIKAYEQGWVKKYIAVSSRVRDSFLDYLPQEAMEVVRNGINEEIYSFRPEPDRDAFRNQFGVYGKYLIGYSGRLDYIKGYENLISIMSWFSSERHDVAFLIATSGGSKLRSFEADLAKKAPRLLKEGRVGVILDVAKMTGGQKNLNDFAYKYFDEYVRSRPLSSLKLYKGISPVPLQAMVDVYIQPSVSEGLPLSVIEAAFTGTPIVAHDVGGMCEIVSNANGKLVDYHHKQRIRTPQFCDAILRVIEQNYGKDGSVDTTEYRRQVRERLLEEFGAKAMGQKTLQIYQS